MRETEGRQHRADEGRAPWGFVVVHPIVAYVVREPDDCAVVLGARIFFKPEVVPRLFQYPPVDVHHCMSSRSLRSSFRSPRISASCALLFPACSRMRRCTDEICASISSMLSDWSFSSSVFVAICPSARTKVAPIPMVRAITLAIVGHGRFLTSMFISDPLATLLRSETPDCAPPPAVLRRPATRNFHSGSRL